MRGLAPAAGHVVCHVLQHHLAWDGFVVKQWQHFFEFWSQLSGHLDFHLGEAKLFVLLQKSEKLFDIPWLLQPTHNNLLAARHVAQHCAWVQCVGVVGQNFSTHLHSFEFVRKVSRFAHFVLSTEDQAQPPNNSIFEHFVGLFSWGIQLWGAFSVERAPHEIFHRDPQQRVKVSHGLHGFQKGFDIHVVVILKPISKCSYFPLQEHPLAVVILLRLQDKLVFQFGKPTMIRRQAVKIQLVGTVKPLNSGSHDFESLPPYVFTHFSQLVPGLM